MRDENQSPMLVSFFDWIVHSSSEQDTHPKFKKKILNKMGYHCDSGPKIAFFFVCQETDFRESPNSLLSFSWFL